jgi:hypothetical protein
LWYNRPKKKKKKNHPSGLSCPHGSNAAPAITNTNPPSSTPPTIISTTILPSVNANIVPILANSVGVTSVAAAVVLSSSSARNSGRYFPNSGGLGVLGDGGVWDLNTMLDSAGRYVSSGIRSAKQKQLTHNSNKHVNSTAPHIPITNNSSSSLSSGINNIGSARAIIPPFHPSSGITANPLFFSSGDSLWSSRVFDSNHESIRSSSSLPSAAANGLWSSANRR